MGLKKKNPLSAAILAEDANQGAEGKAISKAPRRRFR